MTETNHSRRKFVKGLGGAAGITSLAGCADYLGGNDQRDDGPEQDTPPEDSDPTDEPDDDPSNGTEDDDTPEEDTPEEDPLTWEQVLKPEEQIKKHWADQELIQKALNGEKPGEDYGVLWTDEEHGDISLTGENADAAYGASYSHNKEHFDINHFQSLNPDDFEDFLKILNDAVTLGVHKLAYDKQGGGISGFNEQYGYTAELLIDEVFPDINFEFMPASSEGHGFLYAFDEQHGGIVVDSTDDRVGKIGTGVMEGRVGEDWIGKLDLENIKNIDSVQGSAASHLDGLYESGSGKVIFDLDTLQDIYEDMQNGANRTLDTVRPAKATVEYLKRYEDRFNETEFTRINSGSLDNLPNINEYNDFDLYKEELLEFVEPVEN